jgi:hypothetical protein
MNTPHAQPVSPGRAHIEAAPVTEGPFVINLCSSTTPVALSQPQDPELKRFSFFVSRRLEDGRERFRLHMGYFETLQEAEDLLGVVREVYPGAWAGEAPGKRLRAKAAPPAVEPPTLFPARPEPAAPRAPVAAPSIASRPVDRPASAAVGPRSAAASPPRSAPRRDVARPGSPSASVAKPAIPNVPAARSGSPGPGVKPAGAPQRETAKAPVPPREAPRAAVPNPALAHSNPPSTVATAKPGATRLLVAKPGVPAAGAANAGLRGKPGAPKSAASSPRIARSSKPAQLPLSNVREVLASLDETGSTQQMPAVETRSARPPEPGLSDSQVLKLLETRRSDNGRAEDDSSISVLKPDDTGTRRELKEALAANAPVSFAVQLQWSVQAIEIGKLPPLAIFSAYTLYTVEGSREGRRWYGLRLGFFTDALSAKQVAQYVRSEFASVAVVPVGLQERARATATDGKNGKLKSGAAPSPVLDKLPAETSEFKLIDDLPASPAPAPAAPKDKAHAKTEAQKRAGRSTVGRVRAREKRSPQTLEETLEILGADQLEIEEARGEVLNDTGVRHLKMEVRKESPFTKLLDRLSERARRAR